MPTFSGPILPDGAVVDIEIEHSQINKRLLRTLGRPIPQPVPLRALLDTGADITCVDAQKVSGLGLPNLGTLPGNIPALGGKTVNKQLFCGLSIKHPSGQQTQVLVFRNIIIAEITLGVLGYEALLGRDVLEKCRLVYDGRIGQFELTY